MRRKKRSGYSRTQKSIRKQKKEEKHNKAKARHMITNRNFCEKNALGTKDLESSMEGKSEESQQIFGWEKS